MCRKLLIAVGFAIGFAVPATASSPHRVADDSVLVDTDYNVINFALGLSAASDDANNEIDIGLDLTDDFTWTGDHIFNGDFTFPSSGTATTLGTCWFDTALDGGIGGITCGDGAGGDIDFLSGVHTAAVTLAGDVDGDHDSNDLDEAAVEAELEGVLDLLDLQASGLTVGRALTALTATTFGFTTFDLSAGANLAGVLAPLYMSIWVEDGDDTDNFTGVPQSADTQPMRFDDSGDINFISDTGGDIRADIRPGVVEAAMLETDLEGDGLAIAADVLGIDLDTTWNFDYFSTSGLRFVGGTLALLEGCTATTPALIWNPFFPGWGCSAVISPWDDVGDPDNDTSISTGNYDTRILALTSVDEPFTMWTFSYYYGAGTDTNDQTILKLEKAANANDFPLNEFILIEDNENVLDTTGAAIRVTANTLGSFTTVLDFSDDELETSALIKTPSDRLIVGQELDLLDGKTNDIYDENDDALWTGTHTFKQSVVRLDFWDTDNEDGDLDARINFFDNATDDTVFRLYLEKGGALGVFFLISAAGDTVDLGQVASTADINLITATGTLTWDGSTNLDGSELDLLDTMTGKSGADFDFITGTAGSDTHGAKWNADGDLVTTGEAPVAAAHTHTGATLSAIDVSDDVNLTAGAYLTLTGDDVALDVEVYTGGECNGIETPATSDDEMFWRVRVGQQITAVTCIVEAATSATVEIQQCDTAGDNCTVVTTAIVCDVDGQADDGVIDAPDLDVGDWIRMDVTAKTGNPGFVTACVDTTLDD